MYVGEILAVHQMGPLSQKIKIDHLKSVRYVMLWQEWMVGMFATVSIRQLEWTKSHTMIEIIVLNLILTRPFDFVNHWVRPSYSEYIFLAEFTFFFWRKNELGAGNRKILDEFSPSVWQFIFAGIGSEVLQSQLIKYSSVGVVLATVGDDRSDPSFFIFFFIGVDEVECHIQWNLHTGHLIDQTTKQKIITFN